MDDSPTPIIATENEVTSQAGDKLLVSLAFHRDCFVLVWPKIPSDPPAEW